MSLVVDVSVAVKWLIAKRTRMKRKAWRQAATNLHVPRLMASEVASALWRKPGVGEVRIGRIGR